MTDNYNDPYEWYWEKKHLPCKDAKVDGPFEKYYKNGQLHIKSTHKDGKLDGPYEEYYDNGQLWIKCSYKDGRIEGPREWYNKNGELIRLIIHENGHEIGIKDRFLTPEEAIPFWEKEHPNPTTEDFLGYMYGTGGNVITCLVRAGSETLERFFPVDKWATMEAIPELKKIFATVPREEELMKTMLQLDNKLRTTYNLNQRKQERQQQKLATAQHRKQQGDAR